MFIGCIKLCLGSSRQEKEQRVSFNFINKLVILDNGSKLPNPHDKNAINEFITQINTTSKTILGGTIHFILYNPNEQFDKSNNSIQYVIHMCNTKSLLIIHKLNFIFHYDQTQDKTFLNIIPSQNEMISTSEWSFIESLFYNMRFRIKKMYQTN